MNVCMTVSKGMFAELKAAVLPHVAPKDDDRLALRMLRIRTYGDGRWSIDATDARSAIRANGQDHDPELGIADQSGITRLGVAQPEDFCVIALDFFSLRPEATVRLERPAMEGGEMLSYITDGKTTVRLGVFTPVTEDDDPDDHYAPILYPDMDAVIPPMQRGWPTVNTFALMGAGMLDRFAKVKAPIDFAHVGGPTGGPHPLAFFFRGYLTTYRGMFHNAGTRRSEDGQHFFEAMGGLWLRAGEEDPQAPSLLGPDDGDEDGEEG